jgi:outer membrane scaffolding protein for murein synthesis (MipA/OmpV family)
MPDLAGTVEIGPNLNVEIWQSTDKRLKLEFRMPLRQAITLESHPHSAGLTLSPNINLDAREFIGGWKLGMLIGPLWGNQRQHQYFYGVDPEFATPTRPAYDAPGGYSGWRAIAALSRRFGNLYVGGFVRHDDLSGASFAPSPLVRSDHAFTAGFGMSWIFAASSRRVVAED